MVEIKKGEYEYNESILNNFRNFEETYILVDYTNKEVSIVNMYVLEDGYNINIESSHFFVNNGVAKYEVIHVTILDKELINYAKLRCKNAAQETEIYNSYDILLHVCIQFERSLKIGWPIDKMDVENSINYFLKVE